MFKTAKRKLRNAIKFYIDAACIPLAAAGWLIESSSSV